MDSDDYLAPDFVENLLRNIMCSKADIVVAAFDLQYQGKKTIYYKLGFQGVYVAKEIYAECLDDTKVLLTCWGKFFNKKLLENIRFSEELIFSEDLLLVSQLFYLAETIDFLPLYLYHYRIRDNSVTQVFTWRCVDDNRIVLDEMKKFLTQHNVYRKYRSGYILAYFTSVIWLRFFDILHLSPNNFADDISILQKKIDPKIFTFCNIFKVSKNWKQLCLFLALKLPPKVILFMYQIRKKFKRGEISV